MEFATRCASSAGLDLANSDVFVDGRGAHNLVLVDQRRGQVWRFPRGEDGCAALSDSASRLAMLGSHGVPVPRVLDIRLAERPGDGYLLLTFVPGVALDGLDTSSLSGSAQDRLAESLIAAVELAHGVPVEGWPSRGQSWQGIWSSLLGEVLACEELPADLLEAHHNLAADAVEAARLAPIGVFHGDLGGVNIRIDPEAGMVSGLLDWDSAAIGDTATDIAAVLAGLGRGMADVVRARSPRWRAEELRYHTYVRTWPIQSFLWSLRSGSAQDQREAFARLTRSQ